jgi:HTH-type transcriptional regulator, competence development regulator
MLHSKQLTQYPMTTTQPSQTELAKFVSKKRREAGISSKILAERSGLSPAYISRIEKGDYENPSLPTIKALAEGLGLSLQLFLQETGLLNNNKERPSYKLITQSLRHMGYSDTQAEDVVRYARYVKQQRDQ